MYAQYYTEEEENVITVDVLTKTFLGNKAFSLTMCGK